MVKLSINNREVEVEKGSTILDACKKLSIKVPTLCHLDLHEMKFVNKLASCRVCMVELEGSKKLVPACATPVKEGMKILTNSEKAIKARRTIVELLLSNHPTSCLTCSKNLECELQRLAHDLNVRKIEYEGAKSHHPIDFSSRSIVREPDKCILCRRCETMCNEVQTVGALSEIGRGFNTYVGSAFDKTMALTNCTFCGQCVAVCPTGALREVSQINEVWKALRSGKTVLVQTAPAVRVALGEEFGMPVGQDVSGKMVNALKKIGFSKVFDTVFAADLTIWEEAMEFVERFKNKKDLPILTSCCPSWVNFIEVHFPDMLNIPSSCKSPHEMFGSIAKTYYAEKTGINPENIVVVSVMPCVAKKFEAAREELKNSNLKDVDYVITTRELAAMIKERGIEFEDLEDLDFDDPLGESTGAGTIFGTTGGVIEATIRTAYRTLTGEDLRDLEFTELRGFTGIKETSVNINGEEVKIAVANGLGNARKLLESIRNKEKFYHAIEIMACPGGCIDGGGQPFHHGNVAVVKKRAEGIYNIDRNKKKRRSYENESVQKLYREFLGEPGSKLAHELLHTDFSEQKRGAKN